MKGGGGVQYVRHMTTEKSGLIIYIDIKRVCTTDKISGLKFTLFRMGLRSPKKACRIKRGPKKARSQHNKCICVFTLF